MSYALVEDVPASWEQYDAMARTVELVPAGLLLHVAGPTDEGYRIIEVWESEAAWRRFSADHEVALGSVDPVVTARTVVRDLGVVHIVIGQGWPDLVRAAWVDVDPARSSSPGIQEGRFCDEPTTAGLTDDRQQERAQPPTHARPGAGRREPRLR